MHGHPPTPVRPRRVVGLLLVAAAVLLVATAPAAGRRASSPTLPVPPANDDFDAATAVAALPFADTLDTSEATAAADDPSCGSNTSSVWYAYTAPISFTLSASSAGSGYAPSLSVWAGTREDLEPVACGLPGGSVRFEAERGVTYYVMVAGLGGGDLRLALDVFETPHRAVRASRDHEVTPAAEGDRLAWAQAPRRTFEPWTLYVQRKGERKIRVNARGTNGFSGGFDGDTFVYQEVKRGRSDVRLYDLERRKRSSPPAGVNTRSWEWHPTLSGDWLLFGRRSFSKDTGSVVLRNLDTGESVVLDRRRIGRRTILEPGQVSGNYAVWFACTPACDVFVHDIAAGETTRMPDPARRQQYYPAVTPDGTVYYVESGSGCGKNVRLVRHPIGGERKVVGATSRKVDAGYTYASVNPDGTTTVVYSRVRCSPRQYDVFRFLDP